MNARIGGGLPGHVKRKIKRMGGDAQMDLRGGIGGT